MSLSEDYIDHARRALSRVEKRLLELDNTTDRQDGFDEIFREVHSIKGSAGFFDQPALGRRAHQVENILDALRTSRLDYTDDVAAFLMLGRDVLALELEPDADRIDRRPMMTDFDQRYHAVAKRIAVVRRPRFDELREILNMLEAESASSPEILETPHVHELFERLETLREGLRAHREERWSQIVAGDSLATQPEFVDLQEMEQLARRMKDAPLSAADAKRFRQRLAHLQDLHGANPRVMTAVVSLEPLSRFLDDERLALMPQFQTDVRRSMRDLIAAVLGPRGSRVQKMGEILVEEGLLQAEDVVDAVGRQRRLGQILVDDGKVSPADIERSLNVQRRQTDIRDLLDEGQPTHLSVRRARIEELLDAIRRIRELTRSSDGTAPKASALIDDLETRINGLLTVRFRDLVDHMPRYVHDVSKYLKTEADVEIGGEDVEIERHLADRLGAALVHLVNNALAHGIEADAGEREAAGKPARGRIRISAAGEDSRVCVEVADDGRGLDRERIAGKALALGIIDETRNATMSDDDVWRLVFHPRLTTSALVNEISGRGVGMNVVLRSLEELGGSIEIDNRPGRGVTFRLVVPALKRSSN
ncbi:MAG: Hpt domain-containing protein [Deltaproteobacteria bacterium]|nr:Hpt domain-containing protein [Deltaproteobacteria bacterium]